MKSEVLVIVLMLLLLGSGCTPILIDGPYEGYVVDAETGEPIEGAVFAGSWYTAMPTPAGEVNSCYKSSEVVTNKDGYFSLEGLGLRLFSRVRPIIFLIVKEKYWPTGFSWDNKKYFEKKYSYSKDGKRVFSINKIEPPLKGKNSISLPWLLCLQGEMPNYNNERYKTKKIISELSNE